MSLQINYNSTAMQALINVDNVTSALDTNVQRLSSGLKINSPADNPSGLIQSQQFGFQIAGVGQAMSNTQDAANLAKTADSGLSQIQAILNQIRSLAVSAANSALTTPTQLSADQSQITTALQSIDSIANNTEWGNVQLLNGTAGVKSTISDTTDVAGMFVGSTIGGMSPASGAVTLTVNQPATQTSLTTNQTFTGTSAIMPAGTFSINGMSFSADGVAQTVQDVINEVNNASFATGVVASAVPSGANISIQLQATQYGSNFPVNLADGNHLLDTVTNPAPTVAGVNAQATATVPVQTPTGPSTTTVTLTGGNGPTGSGLELVDPSGNVITLTAAGNSSAALAAGENIGQLTTGTVHFQTGQDSGQAVTYTMPDVQTTQLGAGVAAGLNLSNIDLTTQGGAAQALSIIDQSLDQVSTMRGDLGSFTAGLLQPNLSALTTANQNLASARSSIQDTDVAAEMTSYTQNQVLQQSGLAILAQANQDPQKILQLLQKN